MPWIELKVDTTSEAIDWVRTLLPTAGYEGIVHVVSYDKTNSTASWEWTVTFYIPHEPSGAKLVEEIEQRLASLHRTGLTTALQVDVVDTLPAAEDQSPPSHRVAERFVIVPVVDLPATASVDESVDERLNASDDITIHLSESLAFGSGLHPVTVLCLTLLNRHVRPSMNALDLGSGSGILSVAMAKLGANVLALDNDPIAVQATQDAAIQNQVTDRLTAEVGSLGEGSEFGHWMGGTLPASVSSIQAVDRFDVIAANLLARLHMAIAPDYQRALRRTENQSSVLITTGFTSDVEADVLEQFSKAGLEVVDCERCDEWVAFAHRLKTDVEPVS